MLLKIVYIAIFALFLSYCTNSVTVDGENNEGEISSSSLFEDLSSELSSIEELSSLEVSSSDLNESSSVAKPVTQESSSEVSSSSEMSSSSSFYSSSSLSKEEIQELFLESQKDSMAFVFNEDTVRTYNILIEENALAFLDADPMKEEYVNADIEFLGDTIRNVGVRYKGSAGSWSGCVEGDKKVCIKLATKVKFNRDGFEDRRFFGLKKLQFHHMHHDRAQMKERLTYWFYRNMGIPAPRAVHVRLLINGEINGLYVLVEQIDGRFARANFDDGDGNIYKRHYPLTWSGMSPEGIWGYYESVTPDNVLDAKLETNSDDNPNFAIIQGFEADLERAESVDDIKDVFYKWLDVDNWVRQLLIARVTNHWDNIYFQSRGGHNSYWLEEPTTQKLYVIPWDTDMSTFTIVESMLPEWSCPWNRIDITKFEESWFCYSDEWQRAFEYLFTTLYPQIGDLITEWEEQIRETLVEASMVPNSDLYPRGPLPMGDWEAEVSTLRNNIQISKGAIQTWWGTLQ